VVARSLGQAEAYLTVREILAEASTGADGVLWREFSGFGRFRFAALGLSCIADLSAMVLEKRTAAGDFPRDVNNRAALSSHPA